MINVDLSRSKKVIISFNPRLMVVIVMAKLWNKLPIFFSFRSDRYALQRTAYYHRYRRINDMLFVMKAFLCISLGFKWPINSGPEMKWHQLRWRDTLLSGKTPIAEVFCQQFVILSQTYHWVWCASFFCCTS